MNGARRTPRSLATCGLLLSVASFAALFGTLASLMSRPGWDGQLQNMNLPVMVTGFSLVLIIGVAACIPTLMATIRRTDGDGSPMWLIVAAATVSLLSVSMAPWMAFVALQVYWATHR